MLPSGGFWAQVGVLVVNSKVDTWQVTQVLGMNGHGECPGTVNTTTGAITLCKPGFDAEASYWKKYGETMAARVSELPPRGAG